LNNRTTNTRPSTEMVLNGTSHAEIIERTVVAGDLSKLTPGDRTTYYLKVCESIGVNPFTRPFEYVTLNGKLVLYARRDCTDQLRRVHGVSIKITSREVMDDLYVVTAEARTKDGRSDESIGAVALGSLRGEAAANAMMKAETKAKRRATLSLCGLGMMDETEIEPSATRHVADLPKADPVAAPPAREPGEEG
jgi:hypothetical protein